MQTYSNPRIMVVIEDWPSGRQKTKATFVVERNLVAGVWRERAVRTTVNPKTGRPNAPKKLTYAVRMRFVDGLDGRLYVIEDNTDYGHISVMEGTLFSHETIYRGDPRFAEVLALFDVDVAP